MKSRLQRNGCLANQGRNENHNLESAAWLAESGRAACDAAYLSNAPVDFIAELAGARGPGHKHPATVTCRLGGPGANGGRVFAEHGHSCAVIATQGLEWSGRVETRFREMGVRAELIQRNHGSAALSVAAPNGRPGQKDIYAQRIKPGPRLLELKGAPAALISQASVVIAGPMAEPDEESLQVLSWIARTANYAVLQPHPDLVAHRRFAGIAREFDLVVLNSSEAAALESSAPDADFSALRLRRVLGEGASFILTNGPERGLAWLDGSWLTIEPPKVAVVSDVGAGDVFTAEFVRSRVLLGRSPRAALDAAVQTAARWISGQQLTRASHAGACQTRSWAETAL